jgi:ubiquinone/menaquinone biosynthesis C-methylase UbiE
VNALENWFCSTAFWQRITQKQLLPWIVSGSMLGNHVLELGSGPGAGTMELRRRASRVTSLEYSHAFAASLAGRNIGANGSVLQGDAAALPFAEKSFSSVIAVLMLHHLPSTEQQERAFREIFRVLMSGGVFFAFEIQDGWFNRAIHKNSTFVPVQPAAIPARLTAAGFSEVNVDSRRGGFRFRAMRAHEV